MAHRLEEHYAGDEAWAAFVEALPDEWDQCTFKEELWLSLQGNVDLAKLIYFQARDTSLAYINKPVPALDGLSPIACLATPTLLRRLRSMLMRMPV
jgi:hypothetical protein